MTTHDPKHRVVTLYADAASQRRILKNLRTQRFSLPESASAHVRALLDKRIDTVALELAKNFSAANETILSSHHASNPLNSPTTLVRSNRR